MTTEVRLGVNPVLNVVGVCESDPLTIDTVTSNSVNVVNPQYENITFSFIDNPDASTQDQEETDIDPWSQGISLLRTQLQETELPLRKKILQRIGFTTDQTETYKNVLIPHLLGNPTQGTLVELKELFLDSSPGERKEALWQVYLSINLYKKSNDNSYTKSDKVIELQQKVAARKEDFIKILLHLSDTTNTLRELLHDSFKDLLRQGRTYDTEFEQNMNEDEYFLLQSFYSGDNEGVFGNRKEAIERKIYTLVRNNYLQKLRLLPNNQQFMPKYRYHPVTLQHILTDWQREFAKKYPDKEPLQIIPIVDITS